MLFLCLLEGMRVLKMQKQSRFGLAMPTKDRRWRHEREMEHVKCSNLLRTLVALYYVFNFVIDPRGAL